MLFTIMYNFGDVVLVSFPFTNLQTRKQRPAVVISNADYQQSRSDIILMAITSQIRSPLNFGEAIIEHWSEAGLLKPSVIKPLIATLEQTQIIKIMGRLNHMDCNSQGTNNP
jgi:mRNA interferase MazF